MKLVSLFFALALSLAGLGMACGPEKAYCYDEHTTCEQALRDKMAEAAKKAADDEAARDAQADGGATVVGQ